jgi:hypothetical protein
MVAPKKDRIYGSSKNKPGSSSDSKSAESISLSDSTITSVQNKIDEHNKKHPKKKVTLAIAKAVVRRGMGAYSSSHRPTISGGKPNSRVAWGLARLNAFLYKIEKGKSRSGKYSQDNDLIDELGYKHSKFEEGGAINNTNTNVMSFELFAKGGATKEVKKGGITYGPSHADGGIAVKNKSTNEMLEVEGGEGITNKHVMASGKTVKLNGKEMTLCEAVSAINQMEGNGIKFNCDDVKHKQFIQEMAEGGELEQGTRTEEEHIQVLRDLYAKRITPEEATEKIAKDHLKEDTQYYSKLAQMESKIHTRPKGKICGCGCSLKRYENGGRIDSLGYGSFEDMVGSFKSKAPNLVEEKKELIELTLSTGRERVDTDYKAELIKNTPKELHKYWENASHINLYKYGWRLQFTTSRRFAGLCSLEDFGKIEKGNLSKDKNLYLSINFVKSDANWKNTYLDTILHEIAHAIVDEMIILKIGYQSFLQLDPLHQLTEGHGKIWEMVCQAINPNGSCGRFYTNAILETSFKEYKYECQNCEHEGFGNSKNFASNCHKCFKPVLIEKNL